MPQTKQLYLTYDSLFLACRGQCAMSAILSYVFAFLVGILICLCAVPTAGILGYIPQALFSLGGDSLQHLVGSLYFLNQPWLHDSSISLFSVQNMEYPNAPSMGLSDSIPLFTLLVKLAASATGIRIQSISPYYSLSIILQPIAAVFALRSIGKANLASCMAVALFASMLPTWWDRRGHVALFGQWVILLELGFYFRAAKKAPNLKWIRLLNIWPTLIFLIHPYLCVMCLAIAAALPVTELFMANAKQSVKYWLCLTGACLAVLIVATLCGYNRTFGGGGYQHYSMDMLAPFWPEKSSIFPNVPAINVDGEGFQYLGLGIIALLLFAIIGNYSALKNPAHLMKRYAGLIVICIGLLIIATGQLHVAGHAPFSRAYLEHPFSRDLRSCGRFFWPIAYLIILFCVYSLRNARITIWLPVMICCLSLQFKDTKLEVLTPHRLIQAALPLKS